jgi:hypothetical protein
MADKRRIPQSRNSDCQALEDRLDEALKQTFPASDPVTLHQVPREKGAPRANSRNRGARVGRSGTGSA